MTRVIVVGAAGRMGRALRELLGQQDDLSYAAGVDPAGPAELARELASVIGQGDVVAEVALPAATLSDAETCARARVPFVVGTTGHTDEQRARLAEYARTIPIVLAANFSFGVNVLLDLADRAARQLGHDCDIEIRELHHRAKKDAPSGTAAELARVLSRASGRTRLTYGRHGSAEARSPDEIGIHSLRAGDAVGEHTVLFAGPGEQLELIHRATSRQVFARGALAAIRFVRSAKPGMYGMREVIAGKSTTY